MAKVFRVLGTLVEVIFIAFLVPVAILLIGLPVAILLRVILEIAQRL